MKYYHTYTGIFWYKFIDLLTLMNVLVKMLQNAQVYNLMFLNTLTFKTMLHA